MTGWKDWEGKKVFIILKNKRQYSGTILEVEQDTQNILYFITLIDKFNNKIGFVSSEVELIQEEGK